MREICIPNGDRPLSALVWAPPNEHSYMIVICHGFRGGKENGSKIFSFAARLQEAGFGVIAFDFGGSGASPGNFARITLSRQAEDLRSVLDYVEREFESPLILLGRSFGGSTVLAGGARDPRVAGYILWSVPVFLEETFTGMLGDNYEELRAGKTVTIQDEAGSYELYPDLVQDFANHDVRASIAGLGERPVLIVHARDDELVPAENPCYLHGELKDSTLHLIDGAGHRFLEKIRLREDLTLDWLRANFSS